MSAIARKAHLSAEFYRDFTLWTGEQILRGVGNAADGGLNAPLAAILFGYVALEASVNYL